MIFLTMERVAVIDMGSNSFRLVVLCSSTSRAVGGASRGIREATRVGAGWVTRAFCTPSRWTAVRTAATFAAFLRAAGVKHVDAVATSPQANRDPLR